MSDYTRNIIILVAGTVDPVCRQSSKEVRASSYENNGNYYWKDSPELIRQLKELEEKYENLAFFDKHGWSGNNTISNREIAGAYLANRLCGSNGQAAYYPAYFDIDVAFHLIGHSHGGNVINEFTKRAAVAEEWPEQWKIKSITYLSTPFFNNKHKLCTGALAPDCKIISVANQFDLTQRIIADFSMHDLVSAINIAKQGTPDFVKNIEEIKDTSFQMEIHKITEVFSGVINRNPLSLCKLIFNPAAFKLSKSDGKTVYAKILHLLEQIRQVLDEATSIVNKLKNELYYPSDGDACHSNPGFNRHFVSDDLHEKMINMLDKLFSDVGEISSAVQKRNDKSDYSIIPLLCDICPVLNQVINSFTIDSNAEGPIVNLFCELLKNQMEDFDITNSTPIKQLLPSFQSNLVKIDITERDPYYEDTDENHSQKRLRYFKDFAQQLEQAEEAYAKSATQRNLLSLCIKLLAPQIELKDVRDDKINKSIDKLTNILGKRKWGVHRIFIRLITIRGKLKPLRKVACRMQSLLEDYNRFIEENSIELIGQAETKGRSGPKGATRIGTLAHFCMTSHNLSRKRLDTEVLAELTPQFGQLKEKEVEMMAH